jgi:hypothetical protein
MRLPRLRAVTLACTKRSGEGRHFGVQARRFAPRNDSLTRLDFGFVSNFEIRISDFPSIAKST